MRLRSLASVVMLACGLVSAPLAGAQSAQGRVSGIVYDENTRPIKAATIAAENADTGQSFTATTDEKGRFTFIGLRPGTWQFTSAAPGYFAERGSMPIRAGSPNAPIAFTLKKTGAPNGGVLGNVQAKDLQNELANADQLFSQRKYDEAIAAYRAIMEKVPALGTINLQIGNAFMGKKDYDAAIAAYRRSAEGRSEQRQGGCRNRPRGDRARAYRCRRSRAPQGSGKPVRKPRCVRQHRRDQEERRRRRGSGQVVPQGGGSRSDMGEALVQPWPPGAERRRHRTGRAGFQQGHRRRSGFSGSHHGKSDARPTE